MSLLMPVSIECHQCHKQFYVEPWHLRKRLERNKDSRVFCSRKCFGLSKRVQYFIRVKQCHNCHKAFFVSTKQPQRLARPRIFCSKVCSSSYTTRQRKQEEVKIIFARFA